MSGWLSGRRAPLSPPPSHPLTRAPSLPPSLSPTPKNYCCTYTYTHSLSLPLSFGHLLGLAFWVLPSACVFWSWRLPLSVSLPHSLSRTHTLASLSLTHSVSVSLSRTLSGAIGHRLGLAFCVLPSACFFMTWRLNSASSLPHIDAASAFSGDSLFGSAWSNVARLGSHFR